MLELVIYFILDQEKKNLVRNLVNLLRRDPIKPDNINFGFDKSESDIFDVLTQNK